MASIAKFDQWQNSAGVAYGTVLQVVQSAAGSTETTLSGSFNTTVLSATITPKFTTSKILIHVRAHCAIDATTTDYSFGEKILRGATQVFLNGETCYANYAAGTNFQHIGCEYLDSPGSTSSITYNYQIVGSSRGSMRFNRGSSTGSTITLMEIAA